MSPQRKDPITNLDINRLSTEKYQSLPPQLAKFRPGCRSLRNEAEDDCNDYTETSRTDKGYYIDNIRSMNEKIVITDTKRKIININTVIKVLFKKNKEEELLIKRLMLINFQRKVIHYVIGTITSCGENDRIGKEKIKK